MILASKIFPILCSNNKNSSHQTPQTFFYKVLGNFYPPTQPKHTLNILKSGKNQDLKTTIFLFLKIVLFFMFKNSGCSWLTLASEIFPILNSSNKNLSYQPPRPIYNVLGSCYPPTQPKRTLNNLKSGKNKIWKLLFFMFKNITIFMFKNSCFSWFTLASKIFPFLSSNNKNSSYQPPIPFKNVLGNFYSPYATKTHFKYLEEWQKPRFENYYFWLL